MNLREASDAADLVLVRGLFEEYQASLGVDLGFQGFADELATLPGHYASPRGRLWLAVIDERVAGCIGLRPFEGEDCEMKRLYVRSTHRGRGVGRQLAAIAIATAKELGYRWMYLDTLATMSEAASLYVALGFIETQPYRHNPLPGTTYFRLDLAGSPRT